MLRILDQSKKVVRVQHASTDLREPWCTIQLPLKLLLLMVRLGPTYFLFSAKLLPAVTLHNIVFQARVMGGARDAIMAGTFPTYLRTFFANYFGDAGYPEWCVNALRSVGVDLLEGHPSAKVVKGDGAKWEYSDAA